MTRSYGRRNREPAMSRLYNARFSEEVYARIEQWAISNKVSVAEAIRIFVEAALSDDGLLIIQHL